MNNPKKIALIMSEEVGLRTQYLNWKKHFPKSQELVPFWILISFNKQDGWIEALPGLPAFVKTRLRAALEIREGLKHGPFDATFVAVHSALASLPAYAEKHACYTTLDVTPKQLQDFGEYYGKYASRIRQIEDAKHRSRQRNYLAYRSLFPWSHWAAKSLETDYAVPAERIHVIPPGVDLNQWKPGLKQESNICNLLFVGGDFTRKGGNLLLDWASKTSQKNWQLNIVTREKVHTTDDRIKIHLNLSSNDPILTSLYTKSDLFVLPTLADCYSIAGIEALACGLPVILSRTGGTADIIEDGVTGYLLEEPLRDDLGDKLDRLLSNRDLRKSMAFAARSDAVERYDVAANIRRTVDIMLKTC